MNKRHGFLDLANSGKKSIIRWIIGSLAILIGFFFIGSLPSLFICSDQISGFNCSDLNVSQLYDSPPVILEYILLNWAYVIGILFIFMTIRFIHKRRLTQIITHRLTIDYDRMIYAIKIGFIIYGIDLFASFFMGYPPVLNEFSFPRYITFFLFAIILTPIQASMEEIFFRGYILQGTGLVTTSIPILSIINGVLFIVWHIGNPGFIDAIPFYFFFGVLTTYITIKDNGIELAMGLHSINNLFVFLIISPGLESWDNLAIFSGGQTLLGYLIFPIIYAVFSRKYGWGDQWVEKLFDKIKIKV
jgi:membrane protease YdiL (CAAX protease family)